MEIVVLYRESGENRSNLIAVNRFFINFVSIGCIDRPIPTIVK